MEYDQHRIKIIDSFRAIAILVVILYHFFSRWVGDNYYPYGGRYDYFKLGYLGVHFFFIISGFVIYQTLQKTTSFWIFWKKRLIRLLPSLIIASLIIYLFLYFIDTAHLFPQPKLSSLLLSIAFIPPSLSNWIVGKEVYFYINGSYWSLWPEIQFYGFCGLIYFLNPQKFLNRYIILAILFICGNWLFTNICHSNRLGINVPQSYKDFYIVWSTVFSLPAFLTYFSIGVIFFKLYDDKTKMKKSPTWILISLAFFTFAEFYFSHRLKIIAYTLLMILLFILFIYSPKYLSLLKNKYLVNIGLASYFLYLIHEPLGVILINRFSGQFYPQEVIFSLLLIVFFCSLSILYYRKIEINIGAYLKKLNKRG